MSLPPKFVLSLGHSLVFPVDAAVSRASGTLQQGIFFQLMMSAPLLMPWIRGTNLAPRQDRQRAAKHRYFLERRCSHRTRSVHRTTRIQIDQGLWGSFRCRGAVKALSETQQGSADPMSCTHGGKEYVEIKFGFLDLICTFQRERRPYCKGLQAFSSGCQFSKYDIFVKRPDTR